MAESASPTPAEFREPGGAAEPVQVLGIAIYLLVIVVVLSVSLLIILMLWGVRVRRQVRKPLPAVTPADRLWYLKNKKHAEGEPKSPNDVSDDKGQTDENPTGE